jgi:hypothetical protein
MIFAIAFEFKGGKSVAVLQNKRTGGPDTFYTAGAKAFLLVPIVHAVLER